MLEIALTHRQGDFTLEAAFSTGPGVTGLIGPSGAGKTTIVNAVAGLIRPQQGRITLDGEVLVDSAARRFTPPHQRRIGYVFQEARLFPHLTVRANLLYGQRFTPSKAAAAKATAAEVDRVVGLLDLGNLLDRRPRNLSGGEARRVAIGRALLSAPRLLLLDEPMAGLDAERRAEILPFLERLRDGAGLPMILVSHRAEETMRLASHLVVVERGRITATGSLADVLSRNDTPLPAAVGFDPGVVVTGKVTGRDAAWGLSLLRTPLGLVSLPGMDRPLGAEFRLFVNARNVILAAVRPDGLTARNVLPATVVGVDRVDGAQVRVTLDCAGHPLYALATAKSAVEMELAPGRSLSAILGDIAVLG